MTQPKLILITLLASSALLLAGCAPLTAPNTNTADVANTNSANINQTSNTNVDTANWLTYTNNEYGYQFQYPDILFTNYTSQDRFPFTRVSIADAPTEREEDSFVQTKSELQAAQEELQNATVDGHTFILSPFGIKLKAVVSGAEGGSIIKRYYWYEEQYQYSFTFIFPSYEFTLEDFLNEYNTTDKVNNFIEQVQNGTADAKYQNQFNLYDSVMNTAVAANDNANSNTNVNTSDWQTYTNTEYGFSFKYPSGWGNVENSQGLPLWLLFSNRENATDQYLITPVIFVTKQDVEGDSDNLPPFDYQAIDFTKSDSELSADLKRPGAISDTVTKIKIGEKDAVQIYEIKGDLTGQEISTAYFIIPNFTSSNLYFRITINGDMTEKLQKFIETINF